MKVKPKKCIQCQTPFMPRYRSTQMVCSLACSIQFNKPEEIEKRHNQLKNDARPLQYYKAKAKTAFQKWIRLRDEKDPCISCGTTYTKQWDGGHFKKAELFSGVIFNEINCNKQCCYCNGPKMHGNLLEYRKGMVKKYGEDKVLELEEEANKTRHHKYTKFELLEIEKHYKLKTKTLQNGKVF